MNDPKIDIIIITLKNHKTNEQEMKERYTKDGWKNSDKDFDEDT
jgi:hypothetical protein